MQRRWLGEPVRECEVTIEYVDAVITYADAREKSGEHVGIGPQTEGIDWMSLVVGAKLRLAVTRYNFAVAVLKANE